MLLFVLGQIVTLPQSATSQKTATQKTPDSQAGIVKPTEFYISSVFDERMVSDSIGTLLFSTNGKSVTHKIILESGTFNGIKSVLISNLARDISLRPVSIRVKECSITEALSGNDLVFGEIKLVLMFDLDKESGSVPLVQYKNTAKYTRSLSNLSSVQPALQNVLVNSLRFFNNWIDSQAAENPQLAKGLKLTFRDYLEQHDDTVYYHPSRPLVWDDFREKRSPGEFVASVFPSFGYDQHTKMVNGILVIELEIKVFVVKSASWVTPGIRNNYNLKHEQKHFDLVKLVAERFKKKLLSENLTPENYLGIINFEYLEFYREMNKVQQDYDHQTSHGTSVPIQEFWNRKIEAELAELKPQTAN